MISPEVLDLAPDFLTIAIRERVSVAALADERLYLGGRKHGQRVVVEEFEWPGTGMIPSYRIGSTTTTAM